MKRFLTIQLTLILSAIVTIQAQTWTQIGNDIDGEAGGDNSGWAISLSADGSVIATGAPSNDGNGSSSGHVRIYQNQSGVWTQVGNDIDGEAEGDYSGYSVSISSDGSIVAIGASENDGGGSYSGHVRVYEYQSGTWTQIGDDIDGEAGYDNSGSAICMSADGSVVAIGAHDNDGNGSYSGHVRIYQNQADVWTQLGDDIDGSAEYDYSGYSVSLNSDGTTVAIGAPWNESSGAQTGQVRVFEIQSGSWVQKGSDVYGENEFDEAGTSVSLSSDASVLAVGAPKNDDSGEDAGHVRVYEFLSGDWVQKGNDIDGEAGDDLFGSSVSISSDGTTVAIGGPQNAESGGFAGHARVYEYISGAWIQKGNDIDAEAASDNFGHSVSISDDGSIVAIGGPYNEGNGPGSGHVRVFEFISTDIESLEKSGISIYPNPTSDKLYFNSGSNCIQSITIFDMSGKQLIRKATIDKNEVMDLSGYAGGNYLISIQIGNHIYTTTIVRE